MMLDRRTFMAAMGSAVLAMRPSRAASIPRLGVQLYTVRDLLAKDFDGTLAAVAAIGFTEVEFAGYFKRTPQEVRDTLKRHQLTAPAAHVPYDSLTGDAWARVIDDARTVGHRYLVNAWVDESVRKQPDAWKRIAETYNRAGDVSKRAGIQFAYHNHHFEFAPRADAGGKLPYDILLESCDPALVKMEMDLCWIVAAGKDPLDYFSRYPGRFPHGARQGTAEDSRKRRCRLDREHPGRDDRRRKRGRHRLEAHLRPVGHCRHSALLRRARRAEAAAGKPQGQPRLSDTAAILKNNSQPTPKAWALGIGSSECHREPESRALEPRR